MLYLDDPRAAFHPHITPSGDPPELPAWMSRAVALRLPRITIGLATSVPLAKLSPIDIAIIKSGRRWN